LSDRYSSAYTEALKKNREQEKRQQKRIELKEKAKSYLPRNPFRAKPKENEGIRTSSKFSRQIPKEGNRPANVVYVLDRIQKSNDPDLPKKARERSLKEAQIRIQQDGEMRPYYTKHAQAIIGGRPSESEKEAAKQFVNSSLRTYPGNNRDKQVRYSVARWMIAKPVKDEYGDKAPNIFFNEAERSGALKSYEKWIRRYGE